MYCVKCKKKTESTNISEFVTSNNRAMLKAKCVICGSTKCQFVNKKHGQGIFDKVMSVVGEMHLPADKGEHVDNGSFNNMHKYSYCGPGTKYIQRNNEGYQGINELDKMCKLHDQFYTDNLDTASRNISDEALAHRAYEIANDPKYDSTQRNMAKLVYHIMKNKAKFGLGMSKNGKRGSSQRK